MNLLRNIALLALLATFGSACSGARTNIELASEYQTLPMPAFVTADSSQRGQLPRFAQIRVYELTKNCVMPNCPIIWDVVVPEDNSPTEFVYGGFPGFGSQTVISARPLKPDTRYVVITLPGEFGNRSGAGEFVFRVTAEGEVVAD